MNDVEKKTYRWRLDNEPHIALLRHGNKVKTLVLNGAVGTIDEKEVAKWTLASAEACLVGCLRDDPVKVEEVKSLVGELWAILREE